jgi:hypothetical protein
MLDNAVLNWPLSFRRSAGKSSYPSFGTGAIGQMWGKANAFRLTSVQVAALYESATLCFLAQ